MDLIFNNQNSFSNINKELRDKIEIHITYLTFFLLIIFPLLGFNRENNFIFYSLFILILCSLSNRLAFKLFIIFLPLPLVSTIAGLNINLLDIISLILAIHLLLAKEHPIPRKFIWFDKLIIAYYLFSFITIANSGSINIPHIIRYIFEPLIIYLSSKHIIKSKKDIYLITNLLIVGTFFSSLVCIYQFTNIFNVPAWNNQYLSMVDYGIYPEFSAGFTKSENLFYRRPGGFFQFGSELATFIPIVFYLLQNSKYK